MQAIDTEILLRSAKIEEAECLSQLAMRSKSYWPYPQEYLLKCIDVIKFDSNYIENWPVIVAEKAQKILGVASLKTINGDPRLDNLWIEPDFINTGIGKILFRRCILEAQKLEWNLFRIAADPYALGFYEKMGTYKIGDVQSRIKPDLVLPYLEMKI